MWDEDLELELPDFLNRKLNGVVTELPRNVSWKVKNPNEIVWPRKAIEKALRLKAREAKLSRKERAEERERKGDYTL